MEEQAVKQQMQELIAQINYHNQKYYVEDAPEIDDYEYDMLSGNCSSWKTTILSGFNPILPPSAWAVRP